MLTKQEKDGVPRFAVWVPKFNPKEHEMITEEEACDMVDAIINARVNNESD